MQSVSSRIWTRIAVFISYGDNDYTTGTSIRWIRWWWQMRTPTGSRWTTDNYITRCYRWLGSVRFPVPVAVGVSGRQRALGPQWPTVEQPQSSWERSAAMVRRTLGQYVAVCPCPPTYLSHTTNINPFKNKVWKVYFYEEVCPFVHWSLSVCLTMFLRIFVYIYICGYTT